MPEAGKAVAGFVLALAARGRCIEWIAFIRAALQNVNRSATIPTLPFQA
jgi:hypothetical protein